MDIAPPKAAFKEFIGGLTKQPLRALKTSVFAATFLLLFGLFIVIIGKPIYLLLVWLWSVYL